MRINTFVIGIVLAVALLLFAQKRYDGEQARPANISAVLDLTQEMPASEADGHLRRASDEAQQYSVTRLEAPSAFANSLWSVDKIPTERLVGPLVVLDVSRQVRLNPDYQVSMQDIAAWEKAHGDIPMGAIVLAYTGWTPRTHNADLPRKQTLTHPGYSLDTAKFLTEAREIVGLGIDAPGLDSTSSGNTGVRDFTLSHSVYQLENVSSLAVVPPAGATAVVSPAKVENSAIAPARILALVHTPLTPRSRS